MAIKIDGAKILIYGTGGNGLGLYKVLKDRCEVSGFVDKRAAELGNIEGVPVFTIEEAASQYAKDHILFIAVKNVFSHDDIARDLLKVGFTKLVFKQGSVLSGYASDKEKSIDNIYEKLVEHRKYECGFILEDTEDIRLKLEDQFFIKEENEIVTAYCPVEMLFNYKDSYDYPGYNLSCFFPLVELYRTFQGQTCYNQPDAEGGTNGFILYCGEWLYQNKKEMTQSQKESFLESRMSVYEQMQRTYNKDLAFFVRNAPIVSYDNKKFYMSGSGRNRVCFQIAKGNAVIPVRMSRDDYDSWIADDKTLSEFKVFAPIPYPFSATIPAIFVDYQRLFLVPAVNEILKTIYLNHKIMEKGYERMDYVTAEKEVSETSIRILSEDCQVTEDYLISIGFSMEREIDKADYVFLNLASLLGNDEDLNGILLKNVTEFRGKSIYVLMESKKRKEHELMMCSVGYNATKMFEAASGKGFLTGVKYEKSIDFRSIGSR